MYICQAITCLGYCKPNLKKTIKSDHTLSNVMTPPPLSAIMCQYTRSVTFA